MHHSRLCAIMIDCDATTMDASVRFWSGALGAAPKHPDDPTDPYVPLPGAVESLTLDLQRIDGPSRIHLDFETDDVEAEVRRLEALGATRERQIERWWIMRDPSGHLFCVVPPQSDDFPANARRWE